MLWNSDRPRWTKTLKHDFPPQREPSDSDQQYMLNRLSTLLVKIIVSWDLVVGLHDDLTDIIIERIAFTSTEAALQEHVIPVYYVLQYDSQLHLCRYHTCTTRSMIMCFRDSLRRWSVSSFSECATGSVVHGLCVHVFLIHCRRCGIVVVAHSDSYNISCLWFVQASLLIRNKAKKVTYLSYDEQTYRSTRN